VEERDVLDFAGDEERMCRFFRVDGRSGEAGNDGPQLLGVRPGLVAIVAYVPFAVTVCRA